MGASAREALGGTQGTTMGHIDSLGVVEIRDALPRSAFLELRFRDGLLVAEVIIGEYVDENTLMQPGLDGLGGVELRALLHHLREHSRIVRCLAGYEQIAGFAQLPGGDIEEPLVIGSQHSDVHVIVPGNEAAVAHGAQRAPAVEEIGDVVACAEGVNLLEYRQLLLLKSTKIVGTVLHVPALVSFAFSDSLSQSCADSVVRILYFRQR